MSNANESAYPVQTQSFPGRDGDYTVHESSGGLTKREAYAMAAMQGFLASEANGSEDAHLIARWSVGQADALLAVLENSA